MTKTRATPLAPDERRRVILRAVVPLLLSRGVNATTREIAAAAGVAEGTLFRVFPDKESLIRAAIVQAMDPGPLVDELAAIDPSRDLVAAVTEAVGLMTARSLDVAALMATAHQMSCRAGGEAIGQGHAHGHGATPLGPDGTHPVETIIAAVTELLVRHGGTTSLRLQPAVSARMLVAVVLAGVRPGVVEGGARLDPDRLADLFLNGALAERPGAERPC